MKKVLVFVFLSIVSLASYSAVNETGTVENIIIEGSIVSVWLSGDNVTSECSGGARWVLAEGDSLFKEKYSTILAAAASGKAVTFKSTGTCGSWSSNLVYYVQASF